MERMADGTLPPEHFDFRISTAIRAASHAGCQRSKRGVVLWRPDLGLRNLSWGANYLPGGALCTASDSCKAVCGKRCIHAEVAAIRQVSAHELLGAHMLHVKVEGGQPVTSGPPSCWQCSRHIVDAGIAVVWLLHEEGWCSYRGREFHRLTLKNCGIWPPHVTSSGLWECEACNFITMRQSGGHAQSKPCHLCGEELVPLVDGQPGSYR